MVEQNIMAQATAPANLLGEDVCHLVDELEPLLRQRLTNMPTTINFLRLCILPRGALPLAPELPPRKWAKRLQSPERRASPLEG